jgi:beta-glucosidase
VAYVAAMVAFNAGAADLKFEAIPENPFSAPLAKGFLWGAATAAHQIEGGNTLNDWARFESVAGNIRNREQSGAAADHWNRVSEDIGLLRDLGANAYRFSIEWSRLEPAPGQWDEAAWAHYVDEVAQLRAAGVEPMVTLLHFTLPAWLADRGGPAADDFARHFGAFATEAGRRLGSEVRYWCTVNEPNVQMYQGYVAGIWPPGKKDTVAAARAFAGLVRGHAAAARAIRAARPDARIGAAVNLIVFDPARRWWLPDWIAAREADRGFNWAFYDSLERGAITLEIAGFPRLDEPVPGLQGSVDYVGVNYYRRNLVRFSPAAPGLVELLQGPGPLSDAGVEIYPEGLLRLLRRVWERYHLPAIITENGIADRKDEHRAAYIRSHAFAIGQAIREDIPVQGYLHWSLMDNFEWSDGYEPRFGLYRVDYLTQRRTAGRGAAEFGRLAGIVAAATASTTTPAKEARP